MQQEIKNCKTIHIYKSFFIEQPHLGEDRIKPYEMCRKLKQEILFWNGVYSAI